MTVDVATAHWFSQTLLRLHTTTQEGEIETIVKDAQQRMTTRGAPRTRVATARSAEAVLLDFLRDAAHDCRARLRHQRRSPAAAAPNELAALTKREREVLDRISHGETDAGIGRALGISPKTASKHVENILRKLGVETRTAAAAVALARPATSRVPAPTRRPGSSAG